MQHSFKLAIQRASVRSTQDSAPEVCDRRSSLRFRGRPWNLLDDYNSYIIYIVMLIIIIIMLIIIIIIININNDNNM